MKLRRTFACALLSLSFPGIAAAQMVTGTYTGTGADNRAITQVGFQPDVVFIKGDVGQIGALRTSTMGTGDVTKNTTGNTALTANIIQSLDSASGGGFTLGTDTQVNQNGISYYFAAFKSAPGHMVVGSYTGNGTSQSITTIGFSPALVVVADAGNNEVVFRTSASTSTCNFNNNACDTTTGVTALLSNGFTVGSDNTVNQNTRTYHYIAWSSSDVTTGTYTGNGTDNRSISIGFAPEWVWVRGPSTDEVHYPASNSGDNALTFKNTVATTNRIQALESTGFQVGADSRVNTNGTTYIYVAFVRSAPTAVGMSWATATKYASGTYLRWHTGYESENLGFHVYRDVDGKRTRITPGLIAGSGLIVRGRSNGGQTYQWWDTTPGDSADVSYWIEDVDLGGITTMHGPVRAVSSANPAPKGAPSKLLARLLKKEAAVTAGVAAAESSDTGTPRGRAVRGTMAPIVPLSETSALAPLAVTASSSDQVTPSGYVLTPSEYAAALSTQTSLAGGTSIKIAVSSEGWHRITLPQLVWAGYRATADSRTLQLFVDGIEQPLKLINDVNNRLTRSGAVEFYATGTDSPYTSTRVYWLRWGRVFGKRVGSIDALPTGSVSATSFAYTVEHKNRDTFFAALQNGEAENFFGEIVTTDPTDLTISSSLLDTTTPASATLEIVLQGVTDPARHQVGVRINGQAVGSVVFEGAAHVTRSFAVPTSYLVAGDNVLTLVSEGGDSDVSLVDVVRLTYPRLYIAENNRLRLGVDGQQTVAVGGFSAAAVRLLDITSPSMPVEVLGMVRPGAAGYEVTFTAPGSGARTLLAFADPWVPDSVAPNRPSSWKKAANVADYVAVAPASFMPAVQTLKTIREASGLAVATVDIEDVYDEFSFGQKTPYAIRDFLRRAKAAWQVKPRFVVLVGNATSDPRNYLGMDEPDFVPTKIISTRALETASDDWFVDANNDGIPEIAAIGRIPARSLEQANTMVAKIAAYEAGDGSWTRDVMLVADASDEEDLDFAAASRAFVFTFPPDYVVAELFRGELGTAATRAALLQRIDDGQVLVHYAGHGSVQVWRGDVLTTDDVPMMSNGARLPVFVMMNCLNGFFQGLFPEESLAEALVRAGNGGAVAAWASSGFTEPEGQATMTGAFYSLLFDGTGRTLGEAAAAAKQFTTDRDVRRTWIFFGDPALRLAGSR